MKRVSGSHQTTFFSLSPYPSRLLLVLLDNISDKPEERRTDRHNTHFGSEIKFT